MSEVKLFQGDCLEVMQDLIEEGVKADMVLTDPPYGTTKCKWDDVIPFNEMWDCLNKITNENTPICLFGQEPFSSTLRMSNIENYKYDWIWKKSRFSNFLQVKKQPGKITENISVFYKKQPLYNHQMWQSEPYERKASNKPHYREYLNSAPIDKGRKSDGERYPLNILNFKFHNVGNLHPTQKPVALLEYLIKTYTNEDDLVLDFTMGSGSTGVACMETNRNFIGIELEPKYYEIAKTRIKEAKAQKKLI